MVLARLGRAMEEDSLCAAWVGSKRGFSLADAAAAVGGHSMGLDMDNPSSYVYLRTRLAEPCWIIAQMFAAPLMRIAQALARPPAPSRFGALTNEPLGSLHAVVLVSADAAGFHYLDPFYPVDRQPLVLSEEQFAEAWQGQVVIVAT
ncbi:hypothetical protein WME75_34870 [Sorangium sp. So ce1014]|uniref:hypothetical protein n=1 Tax=Sorangium sp. So ce1014 TaxID=3133326 RepID=UPI003F5E8DB1